MDKQTKHLLELFGHKRYSKVENIPKEKMLRIDSNEVTKIIKKNYSLLNCTCESSGKTGHNSLCRHKQFFIILPFLEYFGKELDGLILEYNNYRNLKIPLESNIILNDLTKLKRLIEGKK